MGRSGVTLQEVKQAALQLQGKGKNPSVDAVREVIGSGSKSTIAQHLRDWKAEQSQPSGKLPPDLFALVTGLWERLNLQAEKRITEVKAASFQQLQELNHDLAKVHQDYANLQKRIHQSEETRIAEKTSKEKLEKEIIKEQQEHTKLLERQQANTKQLEDYKLENARLHILANNIQANLEHYQNSIQQLRTEQALAIEKQHLEYQQEAAELQQELTMQRKQIKEYEQQIARNNATLEQLQLLHKQFEDMKQDLQESSKQLVLFKERNGQYQQQLQIANNDLSDKNRQIVECEKQIAILTDHNTRLRDQLSAAEDKIELLRDEKLFLAQEKSKLQGHLNQLEQVLARKVV